MVGLYAEDTSSQRIQRNQAGTGLEAPPHPSQTALGTIVINGLTQLWTSQCPTGWQVSYEGNQKLCYSLTWLSVCLDVDSDRWVTVITCRAQE